MSNREVCSNSVDYSQVSGTRILPFVFTLNLQESILYPETGEFQRFCYDIEGVGEDTSRFADLSHFLLGICKDITEEDIESVSVVLNGIPQNVVWGSNVEIKTEEKPDNPTGCAGLKFDFPLDKVEGVMQVCFSLKRPYAIGNTNVCVFGGNTTANSLFICGPVCGGEDIPCDFTFFQKEKVCVPVTVTPFATPGKAETICCGEPVINEGSQCPGNRTSCSFTVTQTLCIKVPISFGAVIETGKATVQCGEITREECDCDEEEAETREVPITQPVAKERRYFGKGLTQS